MRGRRWASVAVRAPNREIVVRSERLPVHLYAGWISKTPFLRGLTVLWDSLGLGMKALMFSAEVAEREDDEHDADESPTPDPSTVRGSGGDPTKRGRRRAGRRRSGRRSSGRPSPSRCCSGSASSSCYHWEPPRCWS